MSRFLELVVEDHPPLGTTPYPMRVLSVRKAKSVLTVSLEHLAEEQAGRQHETDLALPVRPGNPTARFFAALGFDTSAGSKIRPADAIGRELLVQFSSSSEGEDPQPVAFHPIPEK